jgi:hypothetical protein
MEENHTKTVRMPTWFGVDAVVKIGPGFLHKAGLGRWIIPHPPIINWLLRWGLPKDAYHTLSLFHEFGHLQTTPLTLLYLGSMLTLSVLTGHASWLDILLVILSAHSAWEIGAELFTITRTGGHYEEYYKGISVLPRIIFWLVAVALTLAGWIVVVR